MKACTFFGHRTVSSDLKPKLLYEIKNLVINKDVRVFYVGNEESFDGTVMRVLNELKKEYDIDCFVVLAYMPKQGDELLKAISQYTIYPEGLEAVPKRYAIIKRNEWMLNKADFVITYIRRDIGSGAAKFRDMALKKNKTVIEL